MQMCSSLRLAHAVWRTWLWGFSQESSVTVHTGTSSWLTVDGLESGGFNFIQWELIPIPYVLFFVLLITAIISVSSVLEQPCNLSPTLACVSQFGRSWKTSHWIRCDRGASKPQVMLQKKKKSQSILVSFFSFTLSTNVKRDWRFPPGCCLWPRSMDEWSPSQDNWTTANTPWALCSHWFPTTLVLNDL